jgi:hypothetical protein
MFSAGNAAPGGSEREKFHISAHYYDVVTGELEKANQACELWAQDTAFLRESLYGVAFLQGDTTKMQEQVAWVAGKPGAEATLASFESDTEAFSGHLRKARDFSRRAVESAESAEGKERAAEWQMNSALREAEFGNATEASGETGLALGLASTRDVQVLAALALARVGDLAREQKIADELEKQNAFNTMIIGYWLPPIRAAIEINRSNPGKAAEILRLAIPYELGVPPPEVEFGGFLYAAYIRGQAYLLLRQGNEAGGGVSEIPRTSQHRRELLLGPARPSRSRARVRHARRFRQGPRRLSRFSDVVERRRPRHPHPEAGQGGVR